MLVSCLQGSSMSVANEFDCSAIRISSQDKVLLMLGINGRQYTFKFEIHCIADMDLYKIHFFFNVSNLEMMIVVKKNGISTCTLMKFWLDKEDLPVPSVQYLFGQNQIITLIYD